MTGTPDNSEIICGECVQLFLSAPKSSKISAYQKASHLEKQITDRLESVTDSSEQKHLKEIQDIYSNKIKAIGVFLRPEDRKENCGKNRKFLTGEVRHGFVPDERETDSRFEKQEKITICGDLKEQENLLRKRFDKLVNKKPKEYSIREVKKYGLG